MSSDSSILAVEVGEEEEEFASQSGEETDEEDDESEEISDEEEYVSVGEEYGCSPVSPPVPLKQGPSKNKRWRRGPRSGRKKEKKLLEFRCKLEDAIRGNTLYEAQSPDSNPNSNSNSKSDLWDTTLWGVPLMPSKGHQGTDTILLKFLKAQRFKVPEAFEMLRNTMRWRRGNTVDAMLEDTTEEEEEADISKRVYVEGVDKKGHPVCYNVYGGGMREKKREEFLRWRVRSMERSMRWLDFSDGSGGGRDAFLMVTDMKNAAAVAGVGTKKDVVGLFSKTAVSLFQDHYPELISRHIIINTPFWYYIYHGVLTQYCSHQTRKRFVFARPNRVTETLLKYVAPENIPIQYGGLRRENDEEFTREDKVREFALWGGALINLEIPIAQGQVTVVWDVMVVGWEVTYKEEFVPDDEGSYRVLLRKEKKVGESVRNSFYINEPGKIVITLRNSTFNKKRVFCRHKTKLTLPVYMYI